VRRRYVILLASIVIFTIWTVIAITPLMLEADQAVVQFLHRYLSPTLTQAFALVSGIGKIEVATVLALLTGISLIRSGRTQTALMLWALFMGGNIAELLGKHLLPHLSLVSLLSRPSLISYPAPDLTAYVLEDILHPPYGYPSGHAFRVLLLGTVGWWTWRPTAGRYVTLLRSGLGSGLIIVGVLVGVALVYLRDHRASEVIGGYLLGIICIATLNAVLVHTRTSGGRGLPEAR